MSVAAELASFPGVVAAGEYSYRGDRYSFTGQITDDMARMAAIMCRATTMSEHMQMGMLKSFCPDCASEPPKGWIVRGPGFTVCNVANVFCFLDNSASSVNDIMALMMQRLDDADPTLV